MSTQGNSPDTSLDRHRVLVVSSHPVQYGSPLFRRMAQEPKWDILVAFCSLQGAEPGKDPEFGIKLAWDVPLLDGFPWVQVPNRSPRPGLGRFTGLINPGLWKLVRTGKFDAVVVYGYAYCSFWIAMLAALSARVPLVMGTDSVRLASRGGWWWKRWIKYPLVRFIYRLVDIVVVQSTAGRQYLRSLGVSENRMALANYTVDNEYFARAAAQVDRAAVRARWSISDEALVVLFCAKLVPWKRPQDLLHAYAILCRQRPQIGEAAYLVFAGDGPLRESLEAEARSLGIENHVRFLGFVNQSALPEVYTASDLLVLPSEFEPWGLVVNEAMVCGVPAVVSDQVGARLDLIAPGTTGEIFPTGNQDALAVVLGRRLADREGLKRMGEAARKRMETWSYRQCLEGYGQAFEIAVKLKRPRAAPGN
jgi:glycosyltransferase involved in cell wall biosynthesis